MAIEGLCWVVLGSSIVMMVAAVAGLVSDRYHESMHENLALTAVAMAGLVAALQIYTDGAIHHSGTASIAASSAAYSISRVYKKWREIHQKNAHQGN